MNKRQASAKKPRPPAVDPLTTVLRESGSESVEMQQHPLSKAFSRMNDVDLELLKADIKSRGQLDPIVIVDGTVLDGWHRYRACAEVGIEPMFEQFSGGDPAGYVLSRNLHRRHLTGSQRAAAVVACADWAPAHRPIKVEPGSTLCSFTNEQLAKLAGVTVRTITDAKTAHVAGHGDAVRDGVETVKEAAVDVRSERKAKTPKAAALLSAPLTPVVADHVPSGARRSVHADLPNQAIHSAETAQLRAENQELTRVNASLLSGKAELVAQVRDLQNQIETLENTEKSLEEEASRLQRQIDVLELKVDGMEAER